jgi:NitT/TauT family transport system permease protein
VNWTPIQDNPAEGTEQPRAPRAPSHTLAVEHQLARRFGWADWLLLLALAALVYAGVRLAVDVPDIIEGPQISLSPLALPWYALLSLGRMTAAYGLSVAFTLVYGYAAAYNRRTEQVLLPVLDVLQSIPILSFLPVVLLSLIALVPSQRLAVELAAVVLIFTSQVWNLTFAWYQALTTIPSGLREAGVIFRFNGWLRFKTIQLPFAAVSLVWNSMMSWAGGWFFLMAAEILKLRDRDFRLPGLGSYLHEAASARDLGAMLSGAATLILVIVILDQLLWRPLLAWSERFKLGGAEDDASTSWFYDVLRGSRLVDWFGGAVAMPVADALDRWALKRFPMRQAPDEERPSTGLASYLVLGVMTVLAVLGVYHATRMLTEVSAAEWRQIAIGLGATLLRVFASLAIALSWTVPLGVLIGTKPRLASWLQPLVQLAASIPATALFPVLLLLIVQLPGGLDLGAVLLMLAGTQWYLLFQTIAGAVSIPQDLQSITALMQVKRAQRWRLLVLPALSPYIITGSIIASGGAWNASIVAEYNKLGNDVLETVGLGALIARATNTSDYPLLLAGTLTMVTTVILINRFVWRRLYTLAADRYRLE